MAILGTGTLLLFLLNSCSFFCLQMCLNGGGSCLKVFFLFAYKFFAVLAATMMSVLKQVCEECRAITAATQRLCVALCPCCGEGTTRAEDAQDRAENLDALQEPLVQGATAASDQLVAPLPQEMHDETGNSGIHESRAISQDHLRAAIAEPEQTLRFGGPQLGSDSSHRPPTFCGPAFAFLFSLLPIMPENMWGGLVGAALGTHPLCNTYTGNSWFAEMLRMGWRRPVDLSAMTRDELGGWDIRVWHDIVRGIVVDASAANDAASTSHHAFGLNSRSRAFNVVEKDGPFSEEDRIFNWEEYSNNECWICCCSYPNWDLWVSCRHSFCSKCSEEMMQRVMPCPLCRTMSTVVVRRSALRSEV